MAPRKCCVKTCQNHGNKGPGLHYHGLPRCLDLRKEWIRWIAAVNGCDTTDPIFVKKIFVCSDHFELKDKHSVKLRPRSIPSVLMSTVADTIPPASNCSETVDAGSSGSEKIEIPDENEVLGIFRDFPTLAFQDIAHELNDEGLNIPVSSIVYIDTSNYGTEFSQENTSNEAVCPSVLLQNYALGAQMASTDQRNEDNNTETKINPVINSLKAQANIPKDLPSTSKDMEKPALQIQSKKATPRKKCSANGCTNSGDRFFTFPACLIANKVNHDNTERCKEWIRMAGNVNLLKQDPSTLHGKKHICASHFKTDQFYSIHRVSLLPYAVPTEFQCPALTHDFVSNQFKLKAVTVDEIRDVDDNTYQNREEPEGIAEEPPFTMDATQKKFEDHMHSLEWRCCPRCKEKFFVPKKSTVKCLHSKNVCVNYTALNDMDPGDVPPQLQDLTYTEEQLISPILPTIQVTRLNGHQFGYKGNIINFPQNVKEFAKKLPHRLQDLSSIITVKTTRNLKPVEFQVRAQKIREALEFLIENNPYFSDIEILYILSFRLLGMV